MAIAAISAGMPGPPGDEPPRTDAPRASLAARATVAGLGSSPSDASSSVARSASVERPAPSGARRSRGDPEAGTAARRTCETEDSVARAGRPSRDRPAVIASTPAGRSATFTEAPGDGSALETLARAPDTAGCAEWVRPMESASSVCVVRPARPMGVRVPPADGPALRGGGSSPLPSPGAAAVGVAPCWSEPTIAGAGTPPAATGSDAATGGGLGLGAAGPADTAGNAGAAAGGVGGAGGAADAAAAGADAARRGAGAGGGGAACGGTGRDGSNRWGST